MKSNLSEVRNDLNDGADVIRSRWIISASAFARLAFQGPVPLPCVFVEGMLFLIGVICVDRERGKISNGPFTT